MSGFLLNTIFDRQKIKYFMTKIRSLYPLDGCQIKYHENKFDTKVLNFKVFDTKILVANTFIIFFLRPKIFLVAFYMF